MATKKKALKKVNFTTKRKPAPKKVVKEATVFVVEDIILAQIQLPHPCHIEIQLKENVISLQIGQRDFQWSRETGEFVASGTMLVAEGSGQSGQPSDTTEKAS